MSASKPLENWLVFFNPTHLDYFANIDISKHLVNDTRPFGLALDGGIRRAEFLNLSVHWHIGDFDSFSVPANSIADTLSWKHLSKLAKTDPDPLSITRYALRPDKDFLDGEVALELLKSRRIQNIVFFDFWHGRWDFSLLHFMWLFDNDWLLNKLTILIPNGYCKFVSGSQSFTDLNESNFSILPLDPMHDVELTGSKYSGKSFNFFPGKGHSLSNKFDCNEVNINVSEQSRYLFFVFNNGV